MKEDALARIHREYVEQCKKMGVYQGVDPSSIEREIARWKAECNREPLKQKRRRKHPPKGHAD